MTNLFLDYFSEKNGIDISCELSAWQMIHMKCQDLFSLKKKKKIKILSAAIIFKVGNYFTCVLQIVDMAFVSSEYLY